MRKTSLEPKICVECGGIRKGKHRICPACRARLRRLNDPVGEVYYHVRSNAKHRGVKFELTLAWFRDFIAGTEYMARRGRKRDSLSLDRKINALGYVDNNLQVIPLGDNVRKGSRDPETYEQGRERWGTPF